MTTLADLLMGKVVPPDGEVVDRGAFLPLGTYRRPDGTETTSLAFPQAARDGLDALAYALGYRQDPNAPGGYVTQDALNRGGQGLAESAMVGSFAAPRPSNALTIFAGRRAKTADHGALGRAEGLEAGGAAPEYIWESTGWFRGPDGQWRFEIDDSQSGIRKTMVPMGDAPNRDNALSDVLSHPELYAAYPDAKKVAMDARLAAGPMGGYYAPQRRVGQQTVEGVGAKGATPDDLRRASLHESQHLVQAREGFESGSSPENFSQQADAELARDAMTFRREMDRFSELQSPDARLAAVVDEYKRNGLDDFLPSAEAREIALDYRGNPDDQLRTVVELYGLDRRTSPYTPRELYQRTAGEVEARAVEARRDLTPEQRRARPPWLDYDTPNENMVLIDSLRQKLAANARPGSGVGAAMSAARNQADPQAMAAALDPSPAARLARAREMGFDTENVVYRGMKRGEYDAEKASFSPQWFSNDVDVANSYAGYRPEMEHVLEILMGTDQPSVIPAYIKDGNIVEIDAKGAKWDKIPAELVPAEYQMPELKEPTTGFLRPKYYETTESILARLRGPNQPDAVRFKNVSDHAASHTNKSLSDVTAVLTPSNIRSVNAMFDPAQADSANLLAANPMSGAVPLMFDDPDQRRQMIARHLMQGGA